MRHDWYARGLMLAVIFCIIMPVRGTSTLDEALQLAGEHRDELIASLNDVTPAHRDHMAFLITHMPEDDLTSLSSSFLIEHVETICAAFDAAPWRSTVDERTFRNFVLPYANVNEPRERWANRLREISLPMIDGCTTPGDAALRLNEELFPALGVKYSTKRRAAEQSPSESIEQGMASCTGLSILLVDACRSVGVPARLAGIPEWTTKPGNHTWVEVWSEGEWHFLGAAEPDQRGLNHGWFQPDAARARPDERMHAIYAVSWEPTGVTFPPAWTDASPIVHGINVTHRYLDATARPANTVRVHFGVNDANGDRLATTLRIDTIDGMTLLETRDPSFDRNDMPSIDVPIGTTVVVSMPDHPHVPPTTRFDVDADLVLALDCPADPAAHSTALQRVRDDLRGAWSNELWGTGVRPPFQGTGDVVHERPDDVRRIVWNAYRQSSIHDDNRADMAANIVRHDDHESPYVARHVGERPEGGWPLVIAMHGGGGVPKEINDAQWRHMQIYYRDHPDLGGYIYCALRAPDDAWNGFYRDDVYPLVERLIRNFLLFADVHPDRVHLIGYSHGGYGAFTIGPKMPDRFASIHASAAAPTDGETTAATLMHTRFSCMIGEHDSAYGRIDRCRQFARAVEQLRGDRDDIYPVTVEVIPDLGHGGLPDRDMIPQLYAHRRTSMPRTLRWAQTDAVIHRFFWLADPTPGKAREIIASCHDNVIELSTTNVSRIVLHLDERLVDLHRPIIIRTPNDERLIEPPTTTRLLIDGYRRSVAERGDPALMTSVQITVKLDET